MTNSHMPNPGNPRVSVILRAHNVDAYIGETLASLHEQTEPGFGDHRGG